MHTTTLRSHPPSADAPAGLLARCIAWLAQCRQSRRDIALLSTLDDKQLADIGFSRDQLDRAEWRGQLPERWLG